MTFQRRQAMFAFYSIALVTANLRWFAALIDYAWRNPTASHILLVPFIAVALVFSERSQIFKSTRWAPLSAALPMAVGAAMLAVARMPAFAADALSFAIGGLLMLWVGGFVLFNGPAAARCALFPLLFLVFAVPIPSAVVDAVTHVLKQGSSQAVAALFTLTRTPYYQEGLVFSLPTVSIEIADECSGIRSSIALFLTTLLGGHQLLRSNWNRSLLLLAVVPIAVLKNGLRIVGLTLLAVHVDPDFLKGQLHHDGGFVFFLLGLSIMSPLFVALRNSEAALSKDSE